ncbi:MAG: enoyl-CoA hydratase/isomerase family protein [Verrucomicrobia bacterium]|nr:MAG: enoyl-CoA hydratase/isomerase family protein [Verrucomicrobiota bacterium]
MPVVLVEKKTPNITVITLNRPDRRNALSIQLLTELIASIKLASDETRERILILRGAGMAFCTGLDLKEAQDQTKAHATADLVAHVLGALNDARPVTIAAVHGAAVAGGAGIITRRGLVAGLVMTFLRRQLGERDMRELLLSGELIDAKRALEMGLVNRVVAAGEVMNEALNFADSVLQGAPNAVLQTKRMIEELWSTSVKDDLERALKHHMQARRSAEAREGIAAFNEKRKANWMK